MVWDPVLVWFVVGAVMFAIEMATPGLVMFFFGIGAWVVMALVMLLTMSLNVQLVTFLGVSFVSLVVFRRALTKVFHGHKTTDQDLGRDLDEFVGKKALVREGIRPGAGGKVDFKGTVWSAESDEEIAEGATVEIVSKDNLTLRVRTI